MSQDRLQGLLQRFSVRARGFHAGPLCGLHTFEAPAGVGQLHLVRRGPVDVQHGARRERIECPSLLFYPQGLAHRFATDPVHGADMACAEVEFSAGPASPIVQALPAVIVLPLAELGAADGVLTLLFEEAFGVRCGRQQIVDRLFEVVVVLLLRHLIDRGRVADGTLAGLADPRLSRALVAMHDAPAAPWSLTELAARAGMSRSRFAERFARVVGLPAAAYLARYRIALAQDLIRRGRSIAAVADAVGYGSAAALSRAFSAQCGESPRQWRARWAAGAG